MAPVQKYSDDIIREAAYRFAVEPIKKISEAMNIPLGTIDDWRRGNGQVGIKFHQFLQEARAMLAQEHDARMSKILDDALITIEDRLENGDEQILRDGTPVRKKISGKDASVIMAILFDKRQVGRGQPTAIVHNNKLDKIASQLERIAELSNMKTINGEAKEIKE